MATWRWSSFWLLMLGVLILTAVGCAGRAAGPPLPGAGAIAALLPPLPMSPPDGRQASGTAVDSKTGSEAWLSSPGAVPSGEEMLLTAPPGKLEYAVYAYALPMETGTDWLSVSLSAAEGNTAWVGVSNYTRGCWELFGPFDADADVPLTGYVPFSDWLTVYTVVIAYDESTIAVESTSLYYDDGVRE